MEAVNVAGAKILEAVMVVGYWVTLISGSVKVIRAIASKDAQQALKDALSHGVAFAAIYILKWALDIIKTSFA
jgi:hypothetical protein